MATPSQQSVDFTTVSPQTGSKLLSLPQELKDCIYEMALQDFTVKLKVPDENGDTALSEAPGILLACKEVYQETWKMYYATVTIVVPLDRRTEIIEVDDESGRRRLDTFLRTIEPDKSMLLGTMIETPEMQPVEVGEPRSRYHDSFATSFYETMEQKIHLIEHARRALGRSLLMCWFRSVDGKLQYSKDPLRPFLEWSNTVEDVSWDKQETRLMMDMALTYFDMKLTSRKLVHYQCFGRETGPATPQERAEHKGCESDVELHLYWSNEAQDFRHPP
ncbi:hypothetical protein TI39_contig4120g00001 [Zymoseptoria brevis]|uniref:Uncharacterized protein n=1 Tax=Zymoseptoria brevis TaxID=1047168 RepID=A0A0F4GD81_9PEZI|nr:hypothetical protein TI39_contig4120g00001 [Zymoseptoria brevis]